MIFMRTRHLNYSDNVVRTRTGHEKQDNATCDFCYIFLFCLLNSAFIFKLHVLLAHLDSNLDKNMQAYNALVHCISSSFGICLTYPLISRNEVFQSNISVLMDYHRSYAVDCQSHHSLHDKTFIKNKQGGLSSRSVS